MGSYLFFFERMYLKAMAHRDVRKNVFTAMQLGTSVPPASKADARPNSAPTDTTMVSSATVIQSPFIIQELRTFDAKREAYMGTRPTLRWFSTRNQLPFPCFGTFAHQIGRSDEIINASAARINMETINHSEKISTWSKRRESYHAQSNPHMEQLCINKAEALRDSFYFATKNDYLLIVETLTKQLRMYDVADKKLRGIRSRHFQRIAYYYGAAQRFAEKYGQALPPDMIRDDSLAKLCNTHTLEMYSDIIAKKNNMLATFRQDLANLSKRG